MNEIATTDNPALAWVQSGLESRTLDELRDFVNQCAEQRRLARAALAMALAHMRDRPEFATYGTWSPWCAENVPGLSDRQIRRYVKEGAKLLAGGALEDFSPSGHADPGTASDDDTPDLGEIDRSEGDPTPEPQVEPDPQSAARQAVARYYEAGAPILGALRASLERALAKSEGSESKYLQGVLGAISDVEYAVEGLREVV